LRDFGHLVSAWILVASHWSSNALKGNSTRPKAASRTPAQRTSFQQEAQVVFREIAALGWYRKFRKFLKEQFSSSEQLRAAGFVGGLSWRSDCSRE
jgi:hypothetical protein